MTDRFAGRRVAVTGAAGGIGLAICERLAAQGAQVHGLDLKGLDALPAAVTGHTVDVTSEESVTAVVRALYADDERPVDLVNSAGIVENNVAAEEMPLSEFDRIMAVNLRGVFLTCREFGRELLARGGGAIVNIASMFIFFSTACCAKWAAPSRPCSSPGTAMKMIVASNFRLDITRASSITAEVPEASSFAPGASHFASVGLVHIES